MARLSEEFAAEISRLERHFELARSQETYFPNHFGNASLLLSGADLAFRILRDRSQVFLDVAHNGKWLNTQEVLAAAGQTAGTDVTTFSQLVAAVCEHSDCLIGYLDAASR